MISPDKDEIVSLTLTLEAVAFNEEKMGEHGMRFLCKEAARMIRRLRPDLAFMENNNDSASE